MEMMNNMKLRNKLIVMIIFPVIALIYFLIIGFVSKVCVLSEMKSMKEVSALTVHISELIHELQKERGQDRTFSFK